MRKQVCTAFIGTNGTGKTSLILKYAEMYHKKTGKTVIFIDSDGMEQKLDKYPYIEIKDIFKHKGKMIRILSDSAKIFDELMEQAKINRGRLDCLLILDDARAYLSSRDEPLRRMLVRRRQLNCDIFLTFHGLSEYPPSVFTFTTDFFIFDTKDSYQRLIKNVPDPQTFEAVILSVRDKAKKNPYVYQYFKK
jgi:hypothetical protein